MTRNKAETFESGTVRLISVTRTFVRIDELGSRVSSQHVDDNDLSPLVHVDQKRAKFAIVFVDEVDSIWANFLKRRNHGT